MTDRLTADCSTAELLRKILAVRLRLELRNRLSPIEGLAILSNTIMGPHHELFTYRRRCNRLQKLVLSTRIELVINAYQASVIPFN
jgi:hypothetical protein